MLKEKKTQKTKLKGTYHIHDSGCPEEGEKGVRRGFKDKGNFISSGSDTIELLTTCSTIGTTQQLTLHRSTQFYLSLTGYSPRILAPSIISGLE